MEQNKKRAILKISSFLFLLLFVLFIIILYVYINKNSIFEKYSLQCKNGYATISQERIDKNKIVNLNGEWEFFWDVLLTPEQYGKYRENHQPEIVKVPSYWQKYETDGKHYPSKGYATYRLMIHNESSVENFGMIVRGVAGAYKIFVNGKEVMKKGEVSPELEKARYKFSSESFYFTSLNRDIEIIIQAESGIYFKTGIYLPIELGEQKLILNKYLFQTASDLFLFGIVIIMGFYHISLFLIGYREKAYIYFGVFAFAFSYRMISTGVLLINKIFPGIEQGIDLRIFNFFLFLIMPSFAGFMNDLFKEYFSKIIFHIIMGVSALLMLLDLVSPVLWLDYYLFAYEIFAVFFILYLFYIMILGFIKKNEYTFGFFLGVFFLILATAHDIVKDLGIGLTVSLAPVSIVVFIFIESVVLAVKFSQTFEKTVVLTNELTALNTSYKRFVPENILDVIKKDNLDSISQGDYVETQMGIMLINIKNYKDLSEKLRPEELLGQINQYFNIIGPLVRKYFGFIEKYSNEGIIALFPAKPDSLLWCAKEMIAEMENKQMLLNQERKIDFDICLHYGKIVLGTIGFEEQLNNTIISEEFEQLKELAHLNELMECKVLVTENIYKFIDENAKRQTRYIGNFEKRDKTVLLYEYFGVLDEKEEYLRNFYKDELEEVVIYTINKKYDSALHILNKLKIKNEKDNIVKYYLHILEEIQKQRDQKINGNDQN